MTPDEMALEAQQSIKDGVKMTLVLPRGRSRLLPGFPRGELLSEEGDRDVRRYDPKRILKWLQENDMISPSSP